MLEPQMRIRRRCRLESGRQRRVSVFPATRDVRMPDQHVDRETMEPRTEQGITAKRTELDPRTEKHILSRLISQGASDETSSKHVDPLGVASIQPLEGIDVTTRRRLDVLGFRRWNGARLRLHGRGPRWKSGTEGEGHIPPVG